MFARFYKTTVLLIATISLTSCLKVNEYFDETFPSFEELRLFTSANQTKAIAEGSSVPTDNVITMLTNFHSEGEESFPEYNVLKLFGYDSERDIWRAGALEEKPALFEQPHYRFSPFNWPGGDRILLDYVTVSYNCLMPESSVIPGIVNANCLKVKYVTDSPVSVDVEDPLPKVELVEKLLEYCEHNGINVYDSGEDREAFLEKYEAARDTIEDNEELSSESRDIVNRACWLKMNYYPALFKYLQDDLLYAYGRNVRNDNKGSIKVKFEHAKSWIKVIINNVTENDIYVSGLSFNEVNMGGNLVLDNSKSLFDVFWDFSEIPTPTKKKSTRSGVVPDAFFVPSGCYGPAWEVNKWPEAGSLQGLECKYLKSDIDDGTELGLSGRLSGAMFPNQEPGVIEISYLAWPHSEEGFEEKGQSNVQHIEMGQTLRYLKNGLTEENVRRISVSLPRKYWKMGKVYLYVITISEDEITIDPTEEDWDDPHIVPVEEEPVTTQGDENEEYGNINKNPDWFEE